MLSGRRRLSDKNLPDICCFKAHPSPVWLPPSLRYFPPIVPVVDSATYNKFELYITRSHFPPPLVVLASASPPGDPSRVRRPFTMGNLRIR